MTTLNNDRSDGFATEVALAILLVRSPIRHYTTGVAWRPTEQPGTVRYATTAQIVDLGQRAIRNPRSADNYTTWLADEDPVCVSAKWVFDHYGLEACADLETLRLSARWDQDVAVLAAVDLLSREIAELVKGAAS